MAQYLNDLNNPELLIVKANVDDLQDFSDEHNIASLPTLKLFKNSTELLRVEGCSKSHVDEIRNVINKN